MRLLVCGSRDWIDKNLIREHIKALSNIEVIIEGDARGADRLAGEISEELEIPLLKFPARWHQFGYTAGVLRNKQMLDEGKPDLVLAFHDDIQSSKGTKHMLKIAKDSQVTTRLISH